MRALVEPVKKKKSFVVVLQRASWGEELPAASIAFHTAKAWIPQSGATSPSLSVEY